MIFLVCFQCFSLPQRYFHTYVSPVDAACRCLLFLSIQIMAYWYHLIGRCTVGVIQIALAAVDLHQLAEVILARMQERVYLLFECQDLAE